MIASNGLTMARPTVISPRPLEWRIQSGWQVVVWFRINGNLHLLARRHLSILSSLDDPLPFPPPVRMVSTRSRKDSNQAVSGDKRAAADDNGASSKKPKVEKNQKLQVGKDGDVELKKEESQTKQEESASDIPRSTENKEEGVDAEVKEEVKKDEEEESAEARTRSGPGETKQEVSAKVSVGLTADV